MQRVQPWMLPRVSSRVLAWSRGVYLASGRADLRGRRRGEATASSRSGIKFTCAVVGREILIIGGPYDFGAEEDDLDRRLDRLQIMGNDRPEMLEYVQQRWMNEASDSLFDTRGGPRLATPECGFRRFGERLAAQSEGCGAAVVYV